MTLTIEDSFETTKRIQARPQRNQILAWLASSCFARSSYLLPMTALTEAALQVSLRFAIAFWRQAAIRKRPRRTSAHSFLTSGAHALTTAAALPRLCLHLSERSPRCSLTQAPTRPSPGCTSPQCILMSAAHTLALCRAVGVGVLNKRGRAVALVAVTSTNTAPSDKVLDILIICVLPNLLTS
jgi:hypothetical protein